MNSQIELAKSWFVLAQIFIILAGFMFTISTFALTNFQENIYLSWDVFKDLKNNLIENNSGNLFYAEQMNLTASALSLAEKNKSLGTISFSFGVIFTFLAVFLFFYGRRELTKISRNI